jgi:hypothetical protein
MKELEFSRSLVNALRKHALIHRIENCVSSGLPDIYGACDGHSFWIETKVVQDRLRKPKFERNQILVINQLAQRGVDVFVVVMNKNHLIYGIKAPVVLNEDEVIVHPLDWSFFESQIHIAVHQIITHVRRERKAT